MTNEELIKKAMDARVYSHSPYSNYKVGAAILTKSGNVYVGANIENSAYPAGICAERCAFCNAIAHGEKDFVKIAVVGSSDDRCYPCGVCRQFIVEVAPNIEVICAVDDKDFAVHTIKDLLPHAFTSDSLK